MSRYKPDFHASFLWKMQITWQDKAKAVEGRYLNCAQQQHWCKNIFWQKDKKLVKGARKKDSTLLLFLLALRLCNFLSFSHSNVFLLLSSPHHPHLYKSWRFMQVYYGLWFHAKLMPKKGRREWRKKAFEKVIFPFFFFLCAQLQHSKRIQRDKGKSCFFNLTREYWKELKQI